MDKDDNKQSEKRVKLFTTKQNVIARKKKQASFHVFPRILNFIVFLKTTLSRMQLKIF